MKIIKQTRNDLIKATIVIFALGILTVNAEAKRYSNPFAKINAKERIKYQSYHKNETAKFETDHPDFTSHYTANAKKPKAGTNSKNSRVKYLFYKVGSTNKTTLNRTSNFQTSSQSNFRNNFYNTKSVSTAHEHKRVEVQNFVKKLNQAKRTLIRDTAQAKPHLQYVASQVKQRNLPRELAVVPMVESNFKQKATSNKGAAGIWQIMPATGRRFGLKTSKGYDGRRDVKASTKAALNYLEYLNRRYKGDWKLALAAYNAGEGRVDNAIKRNRKAGKPTGFWDLKLPKQTMAYVPKIMAMSQVIDIPAESND